MSSLRVLTAAEQVAKFLEDEIQAGTWKGVMPGGAALAKDLGVGRMTVDAALDLLEKRKVLIPQGSRMPRRISPKIKSSAGLKVAFLPYLIEDFRLDLDQTWPRS